MASVLYCSPLRFFEWYDADCVYSLDGQSRLDSHIIDTHYTVAFRILDRVIVIFIIHGNVLAVMVYYEVSGWMDDLLTHRPI